MEAGGEVTEAGRARVTLWPVGLAFYPRSQDAPLYSSQEAGRTLFFFFFSIIYLTHSPHHPPSVPTHRAGDIEREFSLAIPVGSLITYLAGGAHCSFLLLELNVELHLCEREVTCQCCCLLCHFPRSWRSLQLQRPPHTWSLVQAAFVTNAGCDVAMTIAS